MYDLGNTTNITIALLVVVILFLIYNRTSPGTEFLISEAVGDVGYVRFYSDYNYSDLLFRIDEDKNSPKYVKYDLKADAKSMDINLPTSSSNASVEIWARFPYSNIGTTQTDTYSIYNIPEYNYQAQPNLKLVARVKPGQRFRSDSIIPSKRFLIKVTL